MLSASDAEQLILDLVHPLNPQNGREDVDLLAASGRILAIDQTSPLDFPHWDNSAMDGYAVRFADVAECSADQPVILEVIEEIPAGSPPQCPIQAGQAARILTGSMMPEGADTVVIQEVVQRQGDRITLVNAPQPYAFVRHRGAFYRAGQPLLSAGMLLSAPDIAVLAAAQCSTVAVYRRPRVAILSTGDELVMPHQPLQPGQIVDSNQYALASAMLQAGAEPVMLGIVPDRPEALKQAIAHAITTADVVLSSGGVSVGDYDYVDQILAELGATLHIRAVAVKPGKPLTVATFPHLASTKAAAQLYFGLPGNPVSALVSTWRFVLPAVRKLSGRSQGWQPDWLIGQTVEALQSGGDRETYLWGRLSLTQGAYNFRPVKGSFSSGNLINLAQINCLAKIPIGETQIAAGQLVEILRI
jgi:molybdopterin molybdotransferase